MKKLLAAIVALSVLLTCAITFVGCSDKNKEQTDSQQNQDGGSDNNGSQVSQQNQTEEYLDASIGKSILLQAYDNTDVQTNVKVVYSSTAYDTYFATFIKVGTGNNMKIKYGFEAISLDEEEGFSYSIYYYFVNVNNTWYMLAERNADGEQSKNKSVIKEVQEDDYTPISAQALLNEAAEFESDSVAILLNSASTVLTCKKITDGNQVTYKIKVTESVSKVSIEYIIQNDLFVSFNGKKGDRDLSAEFTYGYTQFETLDINDYVELVD